MLFLALVLLLGTSSATCSEPDCAFNSTDFDFSEVLQASNGTAAPLTLYWKFGENNTIRFGVDFHSSAGFVAIGISTQGGMKGADIFVARQQDGAFVLEDRWTEDFVTPLMDDHDDLHLINYTIADNRTTFSFWRYTVPCDSSHDLPISKDKIESYVIWAQGQSHTFSQHLPDHRGHAYVFFNGAPPLSVVPPGALELTVTVENYSIPAQETTYVCAYFTLPTDKRYRLVKMESLVGSAHVHHTLLAGCPNNLTADQRIPTNCSMACNQLVIIPSNSPPGAGIPFGQGTLISSLRMQIHYTNPEEFTTLVDGITGYKLWYTEDDGKGLNLGVVMIGSYSIAIPPNNASYQTWGECLVPKNVPASGINVFYNGWHMHLTGRKMWTQKVRNGAEMTPLGRLNYYDYKFQGNAGMTKSQLVPGDRLFTTCEFNSQGINRYTFVGESTYDEMCFNFLVYYPYVPNWGQCIEGGFGDVQDCIMTNCAAEVTACLTNTNCSKIFTSGKYPTSRIDEIPLLANALVCVFDKCQPKRPEFQMLPSKKPLCDAQEMQGASSHTYGLPSLLLSLALLLIPLVSF